MWKAIASNALTLFIVALIGVAGLLAWGQRQYTGPGPLEQAICFRVDRGASLAAVSRALESQGAITDARIFRIGADYSDKAQGLKFGSYLIQPASSMDAIIDQLTRGGQSSCGSEINFRIGVTTAEVILRELDPATQRYEEVAKFDPAAEAAPTAYLDAANDPGIRFRVTLAEGTTVWQAVDSLKRADFLEGATPADLPPEGSLAPDSYEVTKGADRAALLAEMQARQTRILDDLWASRQDGLPYADKAEALVMASIIEKETGVPDERGTVASVFVNRLRQGMRLQTDPTVIYGLGEAFDGNLRKVHLLTDTPWNTYTRAGLPPTPIAMPGKAALMATVQPEPTAALYFVARGDGSSHFSQTLEEHNRAVNRYQR